MLHRYMLHRCMLHTALLHATCHTTQLEESISRSSSGDTSNRRYASRNMSPPRNLRRRSRSRSPTRHPSRYRQTSPPLPKSKQYPTPQPIPPNRTQSFQPGASSPGLSACAICLGRHPHIVAKCKSDTLWDGSRAHCKRSEQGHLVNTNGNTICSDWQRPGGCSATGHDSRHQCSGCGKPTHGAQQCPRAQKA